MTRDGGKPQVKSLDYNTPQGPTTLIHEGPGLGGGNCGKAGTQGAISERPQTSGSPGIGGTNHGPCGSQGRH